MKTAHVASRAIQAARWCASVAVAVLGIASLTLVGCGTVIPRDSPPFGTLRTHIQPQQVYVSAYLAPDDVADAPLVKIRFILQTLKALGELRGLEMDSDGDGPLLAEELAFQSFDLSVLPTQRYPVGGYNGWFCDREFPVGEDLPVVFLLECEFGNTSATVSSLAFSHDRPPWPY